MYFQLKKNLRLPFIIYWCSFIVMSAALVDNKILLVLFHEKSFFDWWAKLDRLIC